VLAANWKMNIGPVEAAKFIAQFLAEYSPQEGKTVAFFPPAVSIATVATLVKHRADIKVGVQNIWHRDNGAFTGEISPELAAEAGAYYCLVGHSERRNEFAESDDVVRQKFTAALRAGLAPLLCVGESRRERVDGRTSEVVGRQLRTVIGELDSSQIGAMALAYEPVWAIGTGDNATPEDASQVHRQLRLLLRQAAGPVNADRIPILYGGSVKPDNAARLLAAPDVDGVLVGGASLDVASWLQIVRA
jgi:triosephosphate isomerase